MMDNLQLWDLLGQASGALSQRFEPVVDEACAARGIDLRTFTLCISVMTFEPEATTPGHLMVRSPYTSSDVFSDRLEIAVDKGLLAVNADGACVLTPAGRSTVLELIGIARREMGRVNPLDEDGTTRLASILGRVVLASLEHEPPPETWSIRLSHKLMPDMQHGMAYIEQAFSCLAAYRDDAHLAAWQDSGLSAMALESLTLFWRGEAASLDDLCRKLARRGHDCKVYVSVLDELRSRGLIHGSNESSEITANGRVFRNEVERNTDEYFFAPWMVISQDERESLARLLKQMVEALSPQDG